MVYLSAKSATWAIIIGDFAETALTKYVITLAAHHPWQFHDTLADAANATLKDHHLRFIFIEDTFFINFIV